MNKNLKEFISRQRLGYLMNESRCFYVDVDNTLLMQDNKILIPDPNRIEIIDCCGGKNYVIPNERNIDVVRKMHAMGFTCVLWSAAGQQWAQQAAKKLNIEHLFQYILSKPEYYLDDKEPNEFMGHNLYQSDDDDGK